MRLAAAVEGNLRDLLETDLQRGERAVTQAVRQAGVGLKEDLRSQTVVAGLGPRLARTWRSEIYPRGGASLGAAALVWSKAPAIMRAFTEGAIIRSKTGLFLAIPTEAAPARGVGGKRISPNNFPDHIYGPLRFVYRRGAPSLLVVDGLRARSGRPGKFAPASKRAASRGHTATVVMFILVPQVRLKKRIDLDEAADRWIAGLPSMIVREWETG